MRLDISKIKKMTIDEIKIFDIAEDDKLKCIASIIEEEKGKSYNEGFKRGCQRGREFVECYKYE